MHFYKQNFKDNILNTYFLIINCIWLFSTTFAEKKILFQMVSKYKNADPILQPVEFTDNL